MENNKNYKSRDDILVGRNAVGEFLENIEKSQKDDASREIEKIFVAKGLEGSAKKIVGKARDLGIVLSFEEKKTLDRLSLGANHQGIIAFVSSYKYYDVEDILEYAKNKNEEPLLLILDGITDAHNLGAIMRTAECAGVHGIIIPKRRSATVNQGAVKTSAGASEYIKVAKVTNLARTIEELKEKGIWIYSCDMMGENYRKVDYQGGVALLLGSEGRGVSKNLQKLSDFTISIPMKGKTESLNVSNAAAIIIYEVASKKWF